MIRIVTSRRRCALKILDYVLSEFDELVTSMRVQTEPVAIQVRFAAVRAADVGHLVPGRLRKTIANPLPAILERLGRTAPRTPRTHSMDLIPETL